jgi:hypothetical protein
VKLAGATMTEWFRVRSVHSIHDEDAVRFRLAQIAATEFLTPKKKKGRDNG